MPAVLFVQQFRSEFQIINISSLQQTKLKLSTDTVLTKVITDDFPLVIRLNTYSLILYNHYQIAQYQQYITIKQILKF